MKFNRRRLVKLFGLSILSISIPINFLFASAKKIINSKLSDQQKNVMFNEGTERPFSSELLNEKRKGFYHCANCENKLFASKFKFDSGTGWPSFSEALPGAFKTKTDYSFGMKRVEVRSKVGDSHLGHVFNDGPEPTNLRYCINSASLKFIPKNNMKEFGYEEYLWLIE